MIRKIELFFRREFWLHLATMFIFMSFFIDFVHVNFYICVLISLVVGVAWELLWKFYKQKPISISDIIATLIGGVLAII